MTASLVVNVTPRRLRVRPWGDDAQDGVLCPRLDTRPKAQVAATRRLGVKEAHIFVEKVTDARHERQLSGAGPCHGAGASSASTSALAKV